jgi:hypothetical protein
MEKAAMNLSKQDHIKNAVEVAIQGFALKRFDEFPTDQQLKQLAERFDNLGPEGHMEAMTFAVGKTIPDVTIDELKAECEATVGFKWAEFDAASARLRKKIDLLVGNLNPQAAVRKLKSTMDKTKDVTLWQALIGPWHMRVQLSRFASEVRESMVEEGQLVRDRDHSFLSVDKMSFDEVAGHVARLRNEGNHKHAEAVKRYAASLGADA